MALAYIPDDAEELLMQLIAAGLGGLNVRLYQNSVSITGSTSLADFNEATYDTYAAQPWDIDPVYEDSGKAWLLDSTITFDPIGSGSQTIYGWYATAVTGGGLVLCAPFAAPKTLVPTDDPIRLALSMAAFDLHS